MPEDKRANNPEQRSLTTDIAIGLGPTAAVVTNHLLNHGRKPKNDPPSKGTKK